MQILLNGNARRFDLPVPLKEDGAIGTKTSTAINAFQSTVMRNANPTSRIEPHDGTLKELVQGLESGVSLDRLCGVMIHSPRSVVSVADTDDVAAVTKKINGGLNGLDDRKDYLQRAKFFMGI